MASLSLRVAAGSVTAPLTGPSPSPPASWATIFPLSRHVSAYIQNRKAAQQVKPAKVPETFWEQHRAELTAYQAAAAYFKAHNIKKLPSLKQLKSERETLISEKAQFYQKYRETRKAWLDLATAQQNLEALHRAEGRRETMRGGLHELDK